MQWPRKQVAYVTRKPEGSKLPLRKGRATKSMYFWKSAEGGGSFSIQKFMLLILGTLNRAFWSWNWYKIVISGFRVCFFNNCIEKNQNKTHFEEGSSSHTSLRTGHTTKSDEFSERFQMAVDPHPPHLRMVPISGNHVHALHTIWNFSENSSNLAQLSLNFKVLRALANCPAVFFLFLTLVFVMKQTKQVGWVG